MNDGWSNPPRLRFGPVEPNHEVSTVQMVLRARLYRNVILSPVIADAESERAGFVAIDKNGVYLDNFYTRRTNSEWARAARSAALAGELDEIRLRCVYGGVIFGHFGHFLIERLARSWWISQNRGLPIIWHSRVSELTAWQRDIFKLLQWDDLPMKFIDRPLSVAQVVLPDLGFMIQSHLAGMQVAALSVFPFRLPNPGRNVWLSRSAIPGRSARLEHVLEEELKGRGWIIIHPESLGLLDQLEALADAEIVAGVQGSAFHLLYLGKEIRARVRIVRRGRADLPVNSNFSLIASAKILPQKVSEFSISDFDEIERDGDERDFIRKIIDFICS